MTSIKKLKKELRSKADPEQAKNLQRFFKTGPGEYGEGDVFLGVRVGESRKIAKRFKDLPFGEIEELLHSKIHEERLMALLILIHRFQKKNDDLKKRIVDLYLENTGYINNWDLVDVSAPKIIGKYFLDKPKDLLYKLAKSESLWERRIAVIATLQFIKHERFNPTLEMAEMLLEDQHDLIHKAVGWMLREIGKRSLDSEENFLKKFYQKMPRTMLRYAIEKFPEKKRKAYLKSKH